jgi:hypothetical protein
MLQSFASVITIETCMLIRSNHWWEYIVQGTFTEQDWKENFRMSQETYLYLCEQLRQELQPESTQLRESVPVEKRVAVTLWCLATTSEYRTIAHLFGLGKSTVCTIVQQTCRAIV